jgi:hypothetical protein
LGDWRDRHRSDGKEAVMKKILNLFFSGIKNQFKAEIDQKALAEFIVWLCQRIPIAEMAERLDPVLKGKKLFEAIDDKIIFEFLQSIREWAKNKLKEN